MNKAGYYLSLKGNTTMGIKSFFVAVFLVFLALNTSAQKTADNYVQYRKVYDIDIKNDTVIDYIAGLKAALTVAKEKKDQFQIAEKSLFLGLLYSKLNSYDLSIDYFLTAVNKFELTKDTIYTIHTLRALSFINTLIDNDSIALTYSKKNLQYCRLVKDTLLMEKNFINLGICYSNLNMEDTAIRYFIKAKEFGEGVKDTIFLQRIYYDIGSFYDKNEDYDRAEYYYYKSINTKKGKDQQIILAHIYYSLSKISDHREQMGKALAQIRKSISLAEKISAYKELDIFYKMYIIILIKMDKAKDLMTVFNKYSEIQNKGFNAEKAEQIAKIKIRYEIDKYETEIALLTTKNKLNESELNASKNRLIVAGVILFLIIVIFVSTVIQYLRIKSSHKKIVEENIKLIKAEEKQILLEKIIGEEKLKTAYPPKTVLPENNKEDIQNEEAENQIKLFSQIAFLMESEKLYILHDLNINTLAKKLNTNRTYLSKAINSVSGKSFNEFINEYRIAEAKRLLYSKESELITIDAIGKKAGFNSKATFFRVFKSLSGVTPNYFLQNARK